jgi:hypothetical protein
MALNDDVAPAAWDFLCGRELTKDQKPQVGVSKHKLDDSEEYAGVFQSIGHVVKEQTPDRRILLYLVDEAEGFNGVKKPNFKEKWIRALRRTLDVKEIGAIFAIGAINTQEIPYVFLDGSIVSRFGQGNYVVLQNFDPAQTKQFLQGLLNQFIDKEKKAALESEHQLTSIKHYNSDHYPFTEDAFESYCDYLVSDGGRAKPREFITKLHATLAAAQSAGKLVVDREFLEQRGEC